MSESESNEDPKIIVDSDWKEQVAKEKEAAGQSESADEVSPAETSDDPGGDEVATQSAEQEVEQETQGFPPPPPASFDVLVSMMFAQAMSMLGQSPDPSAGPGKVNKPYAKHYIDTLEMLGEKTAGNLSDEESKMLSEALHALRMMYVSAGS